MKALDWPIMINRLNDVLDISEIEKDTDIKSSTLRKVKTEVLGIQAWDDAIALLDLYLRTCGTDVPRYGDHNV